MTESIDTTLGKLRAIRRITQEELASAVGVTRQTIIAIEKGHYIPSLLLAIKIANYFKKPVESIFSICKS